MSKNNKYWTSWIHDRECGRPRHIGYADKQKEQLYSSLRDCSFWDAPADVSSNCGGVFNLEFSPDGSTLVATTEKRTILVYDALNHRQIDFVDTGHSDCVNCARFLDSRIFATCSDDTTVALWDIRNLKRKMRTLKGHSNWVKNIEYSDKAGLLVTSGFDGSIYTWDINKYSEIETDYKRAFHTGGLMRTKLSPDSSKLIMSTTGGYMMVIHDLNLDTLASDLRGFKPNTYRVVQLGNGTIPINYAHNHLFTAKRNRIELISDFPPGNDAEMIASLQVHPEGWCVLSRNTSSDENSEWTCVHDIQEFDPNDEIEEEEISAEDNNPQNDNGSAARTSEVESVTRPVVHISMSCVNSSQNPNQPASNPASENNSTSDNSSAGQAIPAPLPTTSSFRFGNIRVRISHRPMPHVDNNSDFLINRETEEYSNNSDYDNGSRQAEQPNSPSNEIDDSNLVDIYTRLASPPSTRPAIFIRAGGEDSSRTFIFVRTQNNSHPDGEEPSNPSGSSESRNSSTLRCSRVPKNRKRLTHYIEEPNVGRGFIKELCFSSDGRLICSPFGYGVRLLAFNDRFSDLSDCVPVNPVKLYESRTNISHSTVVVCTKFSPTHSLLVSGCLGGKISFHQPVL